jgi:hypothetical protein
MSLVILYQGAKATVHEQLLGLEKWNEEQWNSVGTWGYVE